MIRCGAGRSTISTRTFANIEREIGENVATLGLGIGLTTAVFSVVNAELALEFSRELPLNRGLHVKLIVSGYAARLFVDGATTPGRVREVRRLGIRGEAGAAR